MRTLGMTEYITPLQMGTESSTVPKSVIKTIVGGYFWSWAREDASGTNPRISKMATCLAKLRLHCKVLFIELRSSPDNL